MIEAIQEFFLHTVGRELCVFFCSMIPVIELRGAIPLGIGLGMPYWQTYLLAVLGNMVPVPFILLFIRKIIDWMSKSRVKIFRKFSGFLIRKVDKNRSKIEKYSFFGVALFVAIPLPVTGAWTGSLVAAFLDMKFWKAFLSALIGVMVAGVIVSLVVLLIANGATWLSFLVGGSKSAAAFLLAA